MKEASCDDGDPALNFFPVENSASFWKYYKLIAGNEKKYLFAYIPKDITTKVALSITQSNTLLRTCRIEI